MIKDWRKYGVILGIAVAVVLVMSPVSHAAMEEGADQGGVLDFIKRVLGWPVETTQTVGEATGKGLEDTGKGIGEFGDGTGQFLGDTVQGTGDVIAQTPEAVAKAPEAVWTGTVDAVEKTGAFVADTAQAPFKQQE